MLYRKIVPFRKTSPFSAVIGVSPTKETSSTNALTMSVSEFTAFLRGELRANRIPDRKKFIDNLIHRIRTLFSEEQILNCIITYLLEGLLDAPETHQSIIEAIRSLPENSIFHELSKEFASTISLYKSMASGTFDPEQGVLCGVKRSIKRLGLEAHQKMKADAKAVLRNPHSILREAMMRILSERHMTTGDLICDFFEIVRNALLDHKRLFFKAIPLREYLESLYELAFELDPNIRTKTSVLGLLGDMEFLLSVYMDVLDEDQKAGFIYLSRLTMMTKEECLAFHEAISKASNQEHAKTIRDEFARKSKAYNFIFHHDTTTGALSGILPRAIELTQAHRQKVRSKNKAALSMYFINTFTQELRSLIEQNEEARAIFEDVYTRIIEPYVRNYESIIFVDTGYKGTLPALACALCNIFGQGKHTGFYLYSTHKDFGEFIPSLIQEEHLEDEAVKTSGRYKLVERSVKKLHSLVIDPVTREPLVEITPSKYLRFFDDLHHVYNCFNLFRDPLGVN